MKANEIMTSAKRTFSKVGFGLQKKSPEILVGIGIVGAVASCRSGLQGYHQGRCHR